MFYLDVNLLLVQYITVIVIETESKKEMLYFKITQVRKINCVVI